MGLAPSRCCENMGKLVRCEVPVPVFSTSAIAVGHASERKASDSFVDAERR